MHTLCLLGLFLKFVLWNPVAGDSIDRIDKNIELVKLSDKIWLIRTSYSCNGQLDCNSMLVKDMKDMVLVNTPASDSLTGVLLDKIEHKFNRKVTRLVVSHFHDDSAGGLSETQKRGIYSYALDKTRDLLKAENKTISQVFKDSLKIPMQSLSLDLYYFGAGHSIDNIVTWIPEQKVLFGGCLLKSSDTNTKGNISDADLHAWPATVEMVSKRFKNAGFVIPGHSSIGDTSLFSHTLKIVATP